MTAAMERDALHDGAVRPAVTSPKPGRGPGRSTKLKGARPAPFRCARRSIF